MEITKTSLLQILIKRGGSVSLYPLIETGKYPLCTELVPEGLAELSGTENGVGSINITDKGRQFVDAAESTLEQPL